MLLSLFHKLFALLRNGGFVIVEHQPWKSYESDKAINEYIRYERRLGPSESKLRVSTGLF